MIIMNRIATISIICNILVFVSIVYISSRI